MEVTFKKFLKICRPFLQFVYLKVVKILSKLMIMMVKGAYRIALITGSNSHLQEFFHSHSVKYQDNDYTKEIQEILQTKKMIHLDVGAREGELKIIKKYSSFFDNIMCEPEPIEAKHLKSKGYKVIDKCLSNSIGKTTFFELRDIYASSIKRP